MIRTLKTVKKFRFILINAQKTSYPLKQIYNIFQPWCLEMPKEYANVTWTLRTNTFILKEDRLK